MMRGVLSRGVILRTGSNLNGLHVTSLKLHAAITFVLNPIKIIPAISKRYIIFSLASLEQPSALLA